MDRESVIYDEPADEIVAKARASGVDFSKDQLGDWHRAGLIPAPAIDYPGGGGSSSIYLRGTYRQAITCAKLMARFHSVEKVAWLLWVNHFPIREDVCRKLFAKAQEPFIWLHESGVKEDEFTDQTDAALLQIAESKRLANWLGFARRRSKQQISNVLALILTVAIGRFQPADSSEVNSDEKLFNRFLGLTAGAKKKKVFDAPLLADSGAAFRARLDQMGSVLRHLGDRNCLDDYSIADFSTARDEFAKVARVYISVKNAEMQMTGQLSGDATLVKKIFQTLSPTKQAGLVLVWLKCRDIPEWRDGYNSLVMKSGGNK